ncbi:MAG: hypothetical protein K8T26_03485 [Lentisphaerae bacterium]|nr:hypothetical protein [Lentisphaerota bacterium]
MAEYTKSAMKAHAILAGITTACGFALFLATRIPRPPEDFWAPYVAGFNRMSLLMLIFGFIWCVLSLAHEFSNFFDIERPMDSNEFMGSLIAIVVLVVALLATVPGRVPITPRAQMSPESDQARTVEMDQNLRRLVAAGILLSGVALASVPLRRFLRR